MSVKDRTPNVGLLVIRFLLFEVGVMIVLTWEGLKLVGVWALVFAFVSVYLAEIYLMDKYNHGMSSLFQDAFLSVINEKMTKNIVKLFGFSFVGYLPRLVLRTVQEFFLLKHNQTKLGKDWKKIRLILVAAKVDAYTTLVHKIAGDRVS